MTELREIAGKARTISERLDGVSNTRGDCGTENPAEFISLWADKYSDNSHFIRRLEIEDITPEEIRECVLAAQWPPSEPLPDWTASIQDLVTSVEQLTLGHEFDIDAPAETPFPELLQAIARYARKQLPESIPKKVVAPMSEWLIKRLENLAARTLYVEFKSFVNSQDTTLSHADPDNYSDPPTEYYDKFIESMFNGGFKSFCIEYPVFARQTCGVIGFWCDTVEETYQRSLSDKPSLEPTFDIEGSIEALIPLASDTHARGRVPIQVEFECGSVIYKPRNVDSGELFYKILGRLDEKLLTPDIPTPVYLSQDGYGWMEPVPYRDLSDSECAEEYYIRAGVMTCLSFLLNLNDCQLENVIATGDTPTIVDTETILHPRLGYEKDTGPKRTRTLIEETPLMTHLLPYINGYQDDSDEATSDSVLLAGLGTESGKIEVPGVTIPTFEAINTDVMTVVPQNAKLDRTPNTPSIADDDYPPSDHASALVEGFDRACTAVRQLYDDSNFYTPAMDSDSAAGIENRVLFRKTTRYASVLRDATGREELRSGLRLSMAYEGLAEPLIEEVNDPERWWPLFEAERKALMRRDIPRFSSRTDEEVVHHDGIDLEIGPLTAGIDKARNRLDRVTDSEQATWSALVRQAVTKDNEPTRRPAQPDGVAESRLREVAAELSDTVVDASIETSAGEMWFSPASSDPIQLIPAEGPLNYGESGIALLMTALSVETGQDRYQKLAKWLLDRVVDRTLAHEEVTKLGGIRGLGSIVYTLSVIAELTGERVYADHALEVTRLFSPSRIGVHNSFDIMDGGAGAVSGLVAMYERFPHEEVLDLAVDCGERLLAERSRIDGNDVWMTQGDVPGVGFAHGQSGIAYALARLTSVTGDECYASAALDAISFEDTYLAKASSHESISIEQGQEPEWCSGPTGLALARFAIGDLLADNSLRSRGEAMLEQIADSKLHPMDNVCCGNFGRVEALLYADRRVDQDLSPREVAGGSLRRYEQQGYFCLPGHAQSLPNVSFFDGISGVAYSLLRVASPEQLPCVPLLE
jgi:type 2 lantibiotic biosynthesis protein LanM